MKIALLVARVLLGIMFLVFGANGFLHFIPMGPMPGGTAGQFMGAFTASHLSLVVSGLEFLGGLLLLIGRYVPLALVLLGPVVVNIFLYHLLMDPKGLPLAIITVVLWLVCFAAVRQAFAGIFLQRV